MGHIQSTILFHFGSKLEHQPELYELEQIQEEFQSAFEITLEYEPEHGQMMGDLQDSIKDAEAAIAAVGPRNTRASSNRLMSPSITPLVYRRGYLPLLEPAENFGNSPSYEAREPFWVDMIVEWQDVEEGESEDQKVEETLL